jgi:hypothetical protein
VRTGDRRQRRRSDQVPERSRLRRYRIQQPFLQAQRVLQVPPLRGQRVNSRAHVRPPAGDDRVPPPRFQRRLRRGGEPHRVVFPDQPRGADVEQPPGPVAEHRQEVRDMLEKPAAGGPEPERERLRENVFHRPGEVQRQQQRLLLQRLEPVHPPRRHHELQPRPVTLPPPPGKPADRLTACNRDQPQVPDQRHLVRAPNPPRRRPLPRPPWAQRHPGALPAPRLIGQEQLVQPAAIRPHRHHIAHGHPVSTACSASPWRPICRETDTDRHLTVRSS